VSNGANEVPACALRVEFLSVWRVDANKTCIRYAGVMGAQSSYRRHPSLGCSVSHSRSLTDIRHRPTPTLTVQL